MNSKIGSKIKHLRTQCEICQRDLCNDILSRTELSKIENGKVIPSIFQLKHIANVLNVSIDYFLEDKPDENNILVENNTNHNMLYKLYKSQQYYSIISKYEKGLFNNVKNLEFNFYVGYSYYCTEFYNKSICFFKKYISYFLQLEFKDQEKYVENFAVSLNTLSKIALSNCNYNKAIEYLSLGKKHLELQNKTNIRIYHLIISNMGAIYCKSNNYTKCIEILEKFLSENRDLVFIKILPNMHLSLNIAYYNMGEYEKSIKNIENAIFLYNYSGRSYDATHCYLNYINALRYCKKFNEAFEVLNEYKKNCETAKSLHPNFLIQEIILYFNIDNYYMAKTLLKKVNKVNLSSLNRNSYFFIKGHILYLEGNLTQSLYFFKKCEKYFLKHNYTYDLTLIYNDLYKITNNILYKNKSIHFSQLKGKKNILV